jgi:hypothetical protein
MAVQELQSDESSKPIHFTAGGFFRKHLFGILWTSAEVELPELIVCCYASVNNSPQVLRR